MTPPARSALVHVGLNKAGSTSIQGWLALNGPALAAQGVHHDDLGGTAGPALGVPLGLPFLALDSADPAWLPAPRHAARYAIATRADLAARVRDFERRLDASLPPSGTWVASSEFVAGLLRTAPAIGALDRALRARFASVRYLLYLRDPLDWLVSLWNQAVQGGSAQPLDAFLRAAARRDLDGIVRPWEAAVGDRLLLRLLQPDALVGGDLLADLAQALGADLARTRRPPRLNEGLGRRRIRAMSLLNRAARALRLDPPRRLIERVTRPLDGGPRLALTPAQAAAVMALQAPGLERLRRRRFPDRATLFGPPA